MQAENTYIEKLWTGRISSILQKGITGWIILLYDIIILNISMLIIFVLSVFYISKYFPSFTRIFIWFIVFSSLWIWYLKDKNVWRRKKAKEYATEMDRMFIRRVMSKFEIMQSWKIAEESTKRERLIHSRVKIKTKEKLRQSVCYDWVSFLMQIVFILTVAIVWISVFNWRFSYAELVLVIGLGRQLVWQLSKISAIMRNSVDQYAQIEKLREVFDDNDYIASNNSDSGDIFTYKTWNITIKNMGFYYELHNAIFQNFSINIKWWTRTAFVGESWWWKTTLIKLLAWYIRPDKWEIIIDWQKLSKIKLTNYYSHIGYLTQEPSVFDGTIYENLVYALNSKPVKEDIDRAIKDAKCEFILEFEKWLETEIGERWIRLSWGQKQRLAIAKIMLKNPNIILLDEPTSALDSFNEELINMALHNLFKWKTVIVVAHRLQTVKQADRILLLEQGKILEDGTHAELVKLNWKYKKMLDLQSWF